MDTCFLGSTYPGTTENNALFSVVPGEVELTMTHFEASGCPCRIETWLHLCFPMHGYLSVYIPPLYGRYKPEVLLSPVENIIYPAALLSCFDLLFLLLDKPSRDGDEQFVQHVTRVHMYNQHPDLEYEPLEPALMRYVTPLLHLPTPTHD